MMISSDLAIPVLIGLGAMAGALARYFVTLWGTQWSIQRLGTHFPLGTAIVNGIGCWLIGFLTILSQTHGIAATLHPLLITGFLGAFTTFSTYAWDISNFLQAKRYWTSLFYGLGSPSLGLLFVAWGMWVAQQWFSN